MNFSKILNAAGPNVQVTLQNAQGRPPAELVPVIQSAGSRNLVLEIDGTKVSESQAVQLINAAVGSNTSVSISSVNSLTDQGVTNVVKAAKGKKVSVQIDGATTSQVKALQIINAVKGTDLAVTYSAINSLPSQGVTQVFGALGSKAISAQIDGGKSTIDQIVNVLNSATSATTLSLVNGDVLGAAGVLQAIQSAQSKALSISIDANNMTISNIESIVRAMKSNMAVSLSQAHAITANNLSSLVKLAGSKALSLSMSAQTATNDQLKKTVSAAGAKTSITVDTAHAAALSVMLDLIASSSGTNFTPIYNGSQLVVTPTEGSYVIRALEVAPPSSMIVVNSIGVTNFDLQLFLNIIEAANNLP